MKKVSISIKPTLLTTQLFIIAISKLDKKFNKSINQLTPRKRSQVTKLHGIQKSTLKNYKELRNSKSTTDMIKSTAFVKADNNSTRAHKANAHPTSTR